jgi:hypothetical protein
VFTALGLVKIILVLGCHVLFVEVKGTIIFIAKLIALSAKEREKATIICLAPFVMVKG